MPHVRIESDGTIQGSRIIDQDGKEILGWSKVTWLIGPRGVARAYVEFPAVELDVSISTNELERKTP